MTSLVHVTTYETEVECFEHFSKSLVKEMKKFEEMIYDKKGDWWVNDKKFFGLITLERFDIQKFKDHMRELSFWCFPYRSAFSDTEEIMIFSNENFDNLQKLIALMRAGHNLYLNSDLAIIYKRVRSNIIKGFHHGFD